MEYKQDTMKMIFSPDEQRLSSLPSLIDAQDAKFALERVALVFMDQHDRWGNEYRKAPPRNPKEFKANLNLMRKTASQIGKLLSESEIEVTLDDIGVRYYLDSNFLFLLGSEIES